MSSHRRRAARTIGAPSAIASAASGRDCRAGCPIAMRPRRGLRAEAEVSALEAGRGRSPGCDDMVAARMPQTAAHRVGSATNIATALPRSAVRPQERQSFARLVSCGCSYQPQCCSGRLSGGYRGSAEWHTLERRSSAAGQRVNRSLDDAACAGWISPADIGCPRSGANGRLEELA